ncbi:hypothetical protein EDC27_0182 [Desulfosoma caldarium]|uniref:Uncharacterized protein n=1 Tax=Desulfosoma caldarium TaxID=610254 RepID=A0A3N1VJF3_9BACT|nr:hypothetical protein EDC27_0182 [Desulfosoma caldarium]
MHLFPVKPIAIADQSAAPCSGQGFKGCLRAFEPDSEKGDRRIGHHPEPVQLAVVFQVVSLKGLTLMLGALSRIATLWDPLALMPGL